MDMSTGDTRQTNRKSA